MKHFIIGTLLCWGQLSAMQQSSSETPPPFTDEEVKFMRAILDSHELRPAIGAERQTNIQHLEHCFSQIIRFSTLLKDPKVKDPKIILQLGFNLGRAAGVLQDIGGRQHWWKPFEERFLKGDFDGIISLVETYKAQLGMK